MKTTTQEPAGLVTLLRPGQEKRTMRDVKVQVGNPVENSPWASDSVTRAGITMFGLFRTF
jgi:hypothetical protein